MFSINKYDYVGKQLENKHFCYKKKLGFLKNLKYLLMNKKVYANTTVIKIPKFQIMTV